MRRIEGRLDTLLAYAMQLKENLTMKNQSFEPTHGLRDSQGHWLTNSKGHVWTGFERELLAQAEFMQTSISFAGLGVVVAPLPRASNETPVE